MPPLYEQLFELTINVCDKFQTITPISIREMDADEVILLFARYIKYARRKNDNAGNHSTAKAKTKEIVTKNGQRYLIHKYEDTSGLTFGGGA